MFVSDILREKGRNIVSVAPDAIIGDVVKVLSKRRIGAVLVMDADGSVNGILSERDIVGALAEDGMSALTCSAATYMTRNVISCVEDDSLFEIMEAMTEGRFRHLPVLKGDRVVGLVSIGDVVKSRIAEAECETRLMREYISFGGPA